MDYRDSPIVNLAQLDTDSSGRRVEGKKYQCLLSKLCRKGKMKRNKSPMSKESISADSEKRGGAEAEKHL